jgi:chemotaxis signal transduction protein
MSGDTTAIRAADEATLNLVGFRIEHWRFAVRLEQVKTSVMPTDVTRIWLMPEWVRGIISLHGNIVCVLDLGRLLGLDSATSRYSRFIVITDGVADAAIPVHEVFRVPEIPMPLVSALPPTMGQATRELLEGVINISSLPGESKGEGDDSLTLLDSSTLFESPQVMAIRGAVLMGR